MVALADGRDKVEHPEFLEAALLRAPRVPNASLARTPETPCPRRSSSSRRLPAHPLDPRPGAEKPGIPRFER